MADIETDDFSELPSLKEREAALGAQERRDERASIVKVIRERAQMARALVRFGGSSTTVTVLEGLADEIASGAAR